MFDTSATCGSQLGPEVLEGHSSGESVCSYFSHFHCSAAAGFPAFSEFQTLFIGSAGNNRNRQQTELWHSDPCWSDDDR